MIVAVILVVERAKRVVRAGEKATAVATNADKVKAYIFVDLIISRGG